MTQERLTRFKILYAYCKEKCVKPLYMQTKEWEDAINNYVKQINKQ